MQKTSYIALVMIAAATAAGAQPASIVDDAGTLHLPDGEKIPYSDLASDQARRNFIDITRGYEALVQRPAGWKPRPGETEADQERRLYDEVAYIPWLRKRRQSFAVAIEPKMIAGVQTDIRSAERRVGKECVRTCRSRLSRTH